MLLNHSLWTRTRLYSMCLQQSDLIELKELLLRLVGGAVICKAVVAKGIGPLKHAAAVHHLGPGICNKLELAGGRGRDLAQVLQLLTDDFVERLQCLQDDQHFLVDTLTIMQLLNEFPLYLTSVSSLVTVKHHVRHLGLGLCT